MLQADTILRRMYYMRKIRDNLSFPLAIKLYRSALTFVSDTE